MTDECAQHKRASEQGRETKTIAIWTLLCRQSTLAGHVLDWHEAKVDDSPVACSTWIRRLSTSRTLEPVSDRMPTSWMPFCLASFTLAL